MIGFPDSTAIATAVKSMSGDRRRSATLATAMSRERLIAAVKACWDLHLAIVVMPSSPAYAGRVPRRSPKTRYRSKTTSPTDNRTKAACWIKEPPARCRITSNGSICNEHPRTLRDTIRRARAPRTTSCTHCTPRSSRTPPLPQQARSARRILRSQPPRRLKVRRRLSESRANAPSA